MYRVHRIRYLFKCDNLFLPFTITEGEVAPGEAQVLPACTFLFKIFTPSLPPPPVLPVHTLYNFWQYAQLFHLPPSIITRLQCSPFCSIHSLLQPLSFRNSSVPSIKSLVFPVHTISFCNIHTHFNSLLHAVLNAINPIHWCFPSHPPAFLLNTWTYFAISQFYTINMSKQSQ